jgi:multiple sugar transport system permease protein
VLAVALSFSGARSGSLEFSWVGLHNFLAIIPDPQFQRALWNTLWFTIISQAVVVVLALTAAHVSRPRSSGGGWCGSCCSCPGRRRWRSRRSDGRGSLTRRSASSIDFLCWGSPNGGSTGLVSPTLAMIAIVTVHVWRMFPFATVITLAGMSAVPQEISEAAVIDGAGFWRRFFQVTSRCCCRSSRSPCCSAWSSRRPI